MIVKTIFKNQNYQWLMFGRDLDKPEKVIDTNQYVVNTRHRALLIDPGGVELFTPMLASILKYLPIQKITDIFSSHQDPDVISSLGLWDKTIVKANLHAPWIWEGFIRHFGMDRIDYVAVPDEGGSIELDNCVLQIIPAHYLHSSGNLHLYDPEAKILMSGDVGAALEKPGEPLFVSDFDAHCEKMKFFHQRWMPSNRAKQYWIDQVRKLDIEILAPQHGRLFKGDDVARFLDWFEALQVGCAIPFDQPED